MGGLRRCAAADEEQEISVPDDECRRAQGQGAPKEVQGDAVNSASSKVTCPVQSSQEEPSLVASTFGKGAPFRCAEEDASTV